jgi:hypothetical protein
MQSCSWKSPGRAPLFQPAGSPAAEGAVRSGAEIDLDVLDMRLDVGIVREALHQAVAARHADAHGFDDGIEWYRPVDQRPGEAATHPVRTVAVAAGRVVAAIAVIGGGSTAPSITRYGLGPAGASVCAASPDSKRTMVAAPILRPSSRCITTPSRPRTCRSGCSYRCCRRRRGTA